LQRAVFLDWWFRARHTRLVVWSSTSSGPNKGKNNTARKKLKATRRWLKVLLIFLVKYSWSSEEEKIYISKLRIRDRDFRVPSHAVSVKRSF
jgi:hypothetical protein